jgi:hypothetical protein
MQSIFSNALSRAVAKHIDLSATRRETLSWLALLIMQHQGFTFSVYAPMQLPMKALKELIERIRYPGLRLSHLYVG